MVKLNFLKCLNKNLVILTERYYIMADVNAEYWDRLEEDIEKEMKNSDLNLKQLLLELYTTVNKIQIHLMEELD